MVIEITRIKANAEELRQCRTLSDNLIDTIGRAFNTYSNPIVDEGSEEKENETDD